ncbi:sugar kinase [Streptomyces sp. HNM0574]|uniref:PfkB family carbohydrate kinase n=1 Tax=Streptomyces sp. HNM0574 TaxID=2714954 RepID=UPI00146C60D1|nr:sugar kinase [Streptomyces sp. HNM0574]
MTSTPHTDVVCLGESMVTFLPSRPGRLADVPSFERAIGGAESNVACALARTGHTARWLSRVGTDGFGDHLLRGIAEHGVDVTAVGRDPHRPTGIYFRTEGERATTLEADDDPEPVAEVAYYRAGSAASAMSPGTVSLDDADSGRMLHLSGITAALSADCLALLRRLLAPRAGRPLVSFDVNYRVGLWQRTDAGPEVLLDLARGADLVFVGLDEAEAAWGVTGGAAAVRAALPEPAVLVVKDGSTGATAWARGPEGTDEEVTVPALRVDVVTPVGAGDAFAAGFLSATLRGLPLADRLRHGHLTAAAALTEPGDVAEPPARALADRLAALPAPDWTALRLGPGWTAGDAGTSGAAPGSPDPAGETVSSGEPGVSGQTATNASAP